MKNYTEDISESILQRIKEEIKAAGKSQTSIAETCGLTRQGLTNVLNGHTKPSLASLIRILDGVGLTIEFKIKKK